jgi:hypothetical protein
VTEAEWLAATDSKPMLAFLRGKASDRKLRLFACGCVRLVWAWLTDERSRKAIEFAERYSDWGEEDQLLHFLELDRVWQAAGAAGWVVRTPLRWAEEYSEWTATTAGTPDLEGSRRSSQAALLRDLFGNPFRPAPAVEPAWLGWNDGTVPKLASSLYDARAFDRLRVLADALEDAGCADAELPGHLRGPGPHLRGCWAVDLLLGKD